MLVIQSSVTVTPGRRRTGLRSGMHIRVLLADDFPLVRAGIAEALNSNPAIEVVGQAGNAPETIELALKLVPDVVVLDIRMPGGGGMAVLEHLHEELPSTKVLVMTASEKGDKLLGAVSAGATGYLTKHATQRELCDAVIAVYSGAS